MTVVNIEVKEFVENGLLDGEGSNGLLLKEFEERDNREAVAGLKEDITGNGLMVLSLWNIASKYSQLTCPRPVLDFVLLSTIFLTKF